MVGNIDPFDGQQNLEEWIRMVDRTAAFTGWTEDNKFKAALFRLRGEASEHIEQLRDEGHVNSWEDTKNALKARFETSGKEQLYQHLINTGTQGSKTVQEWAQVVRKLSLKALGENGIKTEEAEVAGGGDAAAVEAARRKAEQAGKDATKAVLNYMRKTNFVRGLRSKLRQEVWRKKCETFEDAVKVATEEEALEMAHKEEEVLGCFQGDLGNMAAKPLVNSIVAALEAREAAKEEDRARQMEMQATTFRNNDISHGEGGRYKKQGNYQYTGQRKPMYDGQLPLPRTENRSKQDPSPMHQDQFNSRRYYNRRETEEERRDREERRCFYCHQQGHMRRNCPAFLAALQSGNGPRRLN